MQHQTRVAELVSAVILDDEVAEVAVGDALAIAAAVGADELQTLAIARAEAWRQMRARNVFLHDTRLVLAGSDPVSCLSVAERTALALAGRLQLDPADAARVFGCSPRQFQQQLRRAKMQLVRSATAISLISRPGRCPVVAAGIQRFGTAMDRGKAMHFVSHAAECSICVPTLRLMDKQVWHEYQAAPASTLEPLTPQVPVADLVSRARLNQGWPEAAAAQNRDGKSWLKWSIAAGLVSAILVSLSLWLR